MACEYYVKCEVCAKDKDCPYDHYGDGSAYCGEFICTVRDCQRFICISIEEEMDI